MTTVATATAVKNGKTRCITEKGCRRSSVVGRLKCWEPDRFMVCCIYDRVLALWTRNCTYIIPLFLLLPLLQSSGKTASLMTDSDILSTFLSLLFILYSFLFVSRFVFVSSKMRIFLKELWFVVVCLSRDKKQPRRGTKWAWKIIRPQVEANLAWVAVYWANDEIPSSNRDDASNWSRHIWQLIHNSCALSNQSSCQSLQFSFRFILIFVSADLCLISWFDLDWRWLWLILLKNRVEIESKERGRRIDRSNDWSF